MKTIFNKIAIAIAITLACSCGDYLDIVPDNVPTLDHAFNTMTAAKQYLFTCYSYLPDIESMEYNPALWGGDEVTCYTNARSSRHVHSWYIQRGQQESIAIRRRG